MLRTIFAILIALSITILPYFCSSSISDETMYTVKWVEDGDTIGLSNGMRVRYIGINAPEVDHLISGKQVKTGEPFGIQAKEYNKKLVHLRKVRLEFDHDRYDKYGRLLAYVFLEDNTFVNEQMILEGLAYRLPVQPNVQHLSLFLNAQQKAMSMQRNIWKDISKTKTGVTGNKRSMRFHLPSCKSGKKISLKNRVEFKSIYDAFYMGFAPCRRCNPHYFIKGISPG